MEKDRVTVAIMTPYLSETLTEKFRLRCGEEAMQRQRDRFGQGDTLSAGTTRVDGLDVSLFIVGDTPPPTRRPDLVIIGSTECAEEDVLDMRDMGLIVARYSFFYGGPSGYTGRTPAEGGYALDIPKRVPTVEALLGSAPTLRALRARDATMIRKALEDLSRDLPAPILTTSFLDEVCR